jgi:hypothetical protein
MRRKLAGRGIGIETVWGRGWFMHEDSCAKVDAWLAELS